jgi:chromosome partitioning protein
VVPASVKFREAYARGVPLIHYDRLSAGATAYRAAAEAYLAGRAELPVPDVESAKAEDVYLDQEDAYLREAS